MKPVKEKKKKKQKKPTQDQRTMIREKKPAEAI